MMGNLPCRDVAEKPRVVVAMSGGVDSSASALLLQQEGYDVVGIAMQVWDYRNSNPNSKRATCCAPADFDDARLVAEEAGFPFYVFDFEDSFDEAVIEPFVRSYLKGYTPNPCLECNRKVKFTELRKRARALGCSLVATGHYAQIRDAKNGRKALFTGADPEKDQSYFLYALTQADLQNTLFPVGGMHKSEVRELLRSAGLEIAEKAESQDICFVSGTVAEFIRKKTGNSPAPGPIVSAEGEVLGGHSGIHGYTVGQRKGLGVSAEHPLYVLHIDAEQNQVIVGTKLELEKERFSVMDVNWTCGEVPAESLTVLAKLRYRHQGVPCRVIPRSVNECDVEFLDAWSTVSPGQAAVFYALEEASDGAREVLGGGTIVKESLRGKEAQEDGLE